MDRTLSLEFARVVEAAALRSGRLLGRGQKDEADGLAVDAMRQAFDSVRISGTVVIGEGEIDEAPMLYIGEHVGAGGPEVDIAVDPIEGTNLIAKGQNGAIAVMAIAEKGGLLHAPDMYMEKICVGPRGAGAIDITKSLTENIKNVAVKIVIAEFRSAANPLIVSSLKILVPIVEIIFQPPTAVPIAIAVAQQSFTQIGTSNVSMKPPLSKVNVIIPIAFCASLEP